MRVGWSLGPPVVIWEPNGEAPGTMREREPRVLGSELRPPWARGCEQRCSGRGYGAAVAALGRRGRSVTREQTATPDLDGPESESHLGRLLCSRRLSSLCLRLGRGLA